MNKIFLVTFTVLNLITSSVIGQNKNIAQPELDSGTIEQQFDYIITKSTKFKEFQLIRKVSILKVKAHTLDSLKTVKKDLVTANKSISQIKGKIGQLQSEVITLKDEIETISTAVDNISFLGTPLSKSAYNSVVWSIIVVLLLALIVFIAQFKKSNMVTKRTNNDLSKIEIEFESFKKKAMKKEQEVMRKLQDEINKNTH